jgi:hypothetical protein
MKELLETDGCPYHDHIIMIIDRINQEETLYKSFGQYIIVGVHLIILNYSQSLGVVHP